MPDKQLVEYDYQHGHVAGIRLNGQVLTEHEYHQGLEKVRTQGMMQSTFMHDEQGRLIEHTRQQQAMASASDFQLGAFDPDYVNQMRQDNASKVTRRYDYNAKGQIHRIHDSRDAKPLEYRYNEIDQLIATTGRIDEHLVHDPAGNLLHNSAMQSKVPEAKNNQLSAFHRTEFEYDEWGNQISATHYPNGLTDKSVAERTEYQYDCQNRLIKLLTPDGTVTEYVYDEIPKPPEDTCFRAITKCSIQGVTMKKCRDLSNWHNAVVGIL